MVMNGKDRKGMAQKPNGVVTRRLKQSVADDPERLTQLDAATQQQLQQLKSPPCRLREELSSPFSRPSTKSTSSSTKIYLMKQLESTIWVQCDNSACFKWRRVTSAELEGVTDETKWFCSMNRDKQYASCDTPEEDTEWYDKAAKKVGLCYVKTPICEGSLVWAKMSGYCKWPSIVTKDPCNHMHCIAMSSGEPAWYHVEFLGGSHTHSWVRAASVKLFTLHSTPHIAPVRKPGFRGHRKGRNTSILKGVCMNKSIEKKVYKHGISVDDACSEARNLFHLTNSERLAMCKYLKVEPEEVHVVEAVSQPKLEVVEKTIRKRGVKPGTKRKMSTSNEENKENSSSNVSDLCTKSPMYDSHISENHKKFMDLKFSDSLVNHSKEEKLVLDIQMYQRNERAFEHDVLRFMKRNDMRFRGLPCWQNTSVSLFQLFLAVHERGGYEKVCSVRGSWAQVYKELTECTNHGEVAKKYYKRNLYPYELFIKGQDFSKALPLQQKDWKRTRVTETNTSLTESKEQCVMSMLNTVTKPKEKEEIHMEDSGLEHNSLLSSEHSVDLMEILGHLENDDSLLCLEEDVMMSKAKLGIDITFFDQSPRKPSIHSQNIKEADITPDFGYAAHPKYGVIEKVQEVPDVCAETDSNGSSCSKLLHEMQALQDDINMVADEMDFF